MRTRSAPAAGGDCFTQAMNSRASRSKGAAVPRRCGSMRIESMPFSTRFFERSPVCHVPPPVSAPPSNSHTTASP